MARKKTAPLSIAERLAQKAGKQAPETPKSGKKPRSVMPLSEDQQLAINDFLALELVNEDVKGKASAARSNILPFLIKHLEDLWVKQSSKPENPSVATAEGSCIFQAVDKTGKFRIPLDEQGNPRDFTQFLADVGIPNGVIQEVSKDVKTTPVYEIASPTELEKKNPKLATKLVNTILESGVFNDNEISELITERIDVSLEDNFLNRVAKYLDKVNATEKVAVLDRLIQATKCVEFRISQKRWNGDIREAYAKAIETNVNDIVSASASPFEVITEDKIYKLEARGLTATVTRISDGAIRCVKKCKDVGHAKNSVKKWQRDSASLLASMNEYCDGV